MSTPYYYQNCARVHPSKICKKTPHENFSTDLEIETIEIEKTNAPPAQPSNEELVAFEKFWREYEDYMAPEDGPTANPDYIGLCRGQEINELVPNSTNTILPISSTNTMPFNSTPYHNIVLTRESDAHPATVRIARNEIANQIHPLIKSINNLKRELSSSLDGKIANQNQLLIRLYQQKASKQDLKDNSINFDGRDNINYAPWKKDLEIEIRDLLLAASQELLLLESRTELEPLQIIKILCYVKYEISAEFALQMA